MRRASDAARYPQPASGGLGWAFSSGAHVAWVTDEIDRPNRISRVLTARARWDMVGAATGMVAFGVLGWATGLATAIVVSGVAMAVLGLFVATRFTEHNFTPTREQRWSASLSIFRRGVTLARRDHQILLVFAATMIINGAGEVARLFPKRLVELGFPEDPDPIVWFTALGILSLAVGVVALRIVEGAHRRRRRRPANLCARLLRRCTRLGRARPRTRRPHR